MALFGDLRYSETDSEDASKGWRVLREAGGECYF